MKGYAGKVLIIVQNLPVPLDRRVWLEAKTLRDHGYKVSIICPKSVEYPASRENIENIAVYRYKMPINAEGICGYIMEFAYAWLATALLSIRVLRERGFDVIQACNPPDTYFVLGLLYRPLGKKFIYDHHDLSPEMYLAKYEANKGFLYHVLLWLEKMTMRTAAVVISTNESYRKVALTRGEKSPDDVFVLRTGPEVNSLVPLPSSPGLRDGKDYMVCYLGEMCPQDGVEYFLRAAHHLVHNIKRNDIHFVLIGGGPAVPKLKELCAFLGLNQVVRFTGRLPDEAVGKYLSTADLCVDPDPWSVWADCSTMNKVLEYMSFGRPVVAFDLKEIRNSAQFAAEYVVPNNYILYAEKISELLDDPEKRRIMGEYGRRRVVKELSWGHTHKNLLFAYRKAFGLPAFTDACPMQAIQSSCSADIFEFDRSAGVGAAKGAIFHYSGNRELQ